MINPLYKSPDNYQKHLALSVQRGVQGGGSGKKGREKAALNPYECACLARPATLRAFSSAATPHEENA